MECNPCVPTKAYHLPPAVPHYSLLFLSLCYHLSCCDRLTAAVSSGAGSQLLILWNHGYHQKMVLIINMKKNTVYRIYSITAVWLKTQATACFRSCEMCPHTHHLNTTPLLLPYTKRSDRKTTPYTHYCSTWILPPRRLKPSLPIPFPHSYYKIRNSKPIRVRWVLRDLNRK